MEVAEGDFTLGDRLANEVMARHRFSFDGWRVRQMEILDGEASASSATADTSAETLVIMEAVVVEAVVVEIDPR